MTPTIGARQPLRAFAAVLVFLATGAGALLVEGARLAPQRQSQDALEAEIMRLHREIQGVAVARRQWAAFTKERDNLRRELDLLKAILPTTVESETAKARIAAAAEGLGMELQDLSVSDSWRLDFYTEVRLIARFRARPEEIDSLIGVLEASESPCRVRSLSLYFESGKPPFCRLEVGFFARGKPKS